jgi:3-oxoacyl-[acyl-carrier-protein] synthase II
MSRRVMLTGIGALTPIGSGCEGLWHGVRRGKPAARRITRFDASPFKPKIAAEIDSFDPSEYMAAKKARRLDRFSQLSIAAGRQALEDANLPPDDGPRKNVAVYLGSALGGSAFGEAEHERYLEGGLRAVAPMLALSVFGGAGATNVAMEFDLRGPAMGNSNSCASGAMAVGEAFRLVGADGADVALAGGVEAPLAPLIFGAFSLIRALSTQNEKPATASRPFDRGRDGFLMAEGGAMLVLEELEHALSRGARPYAEVLGYGATNDAYHMTAPRPSGEEAAASMMLAMEEAGLSPGDVGYVNAHATATPLGDPAEALAIRLAFGEHADDLPVSCTKGLHGHALGASGAIEAAITALVLDRGWLPPTTNLDDPDPDCSLRHVRAGGEEECVGAALTNSFGFGGFNASIALGRWGEG